MGESFGQRLRKFRIDAHLTQEHLAERAAISSRTIRDLERGAVLAPRMHTALALTDALGLTGAERSGLLAAAEQARWAGQEPPDEPAPPLSFVPRQLPRDLSGFVGRERELRLLGKYGGGHSPGLGATTPVVAIVGTAGVGKTALAVHWAHQACHRFPDGQLYVNLRGFDPAGQPMSAAEAVRGFLDAFAVPADRIPVGVEAQSSLYRSILAGRRMLVLLDNARNAAQVRPLLPGSAGCVVLVTSRLRLSGLVATEGAQPLTVDLLPVTEARELLTRRLGAARITAEPEAVAQIITHCARLPLALSIVAARAAMHPGFTLATLAEQLQQAGGGLKAFEGAEAADDVRAVFSWSYQRLEPAQARLFRLLGLHPGPDLTAAAAASLAGVDVEQARRSLTELAGYHLVTEQVPGRFGFHDLLRAYAAELVETHETVDDQGAARRRILDHYLHSSHAADMLLLLPSRNPITLPDVLPGVIPEKLPDHSAALAWFEVEYAVLLAAVNLATATGHATHAWQLSSTMSEFSFRRWYLTDLARIEKTALITTQRYGDRYGQAHIQRNLGRTLALLGHIDEAHDLFRQALVLFTELDDEAGQASSCLGIGTVAAIQGKSSDAISYFRRAVDLYHAAASIHGMALALNNLGYTQAKLGEPLSALSHCRQALTLNQDIGDRRLEADLLDSIGFAHHLLGQHDEAVSFLQQAATLYRQLSNSHNIAIALDHLGDAHHAAGNHDAAQTAWQEARNILEELDIINRGMGPGNPNANRINAELWLVDRPTEA